jgi:hypothetical protein
MVRDGRSVERDLHQELLKQKGFITTDTAIQLTILLRTASSNCFFLYSAEPKVMTSSGMLSPLPRLRTEAHNPKVARFAQVLPPL